jgi:ABC-type amino acid transport substrate-binding protein
MRRVIPAVAALLAALLAAAPASAACDDYVPQKRPQNASRDIVGQSLDAIRQRGFIDVALYSDFPPYSYEEDGKAAGVDVDIARLVAEALGVEPRFHLVAAGETLDADLRNWIWQGPVVGGRVSNLMMHVPYDPQFACRVEQVVFTGAYFDEALGIAYSAAEFPEDGPTPPYFRFHTVGVENDSIADFYLSNFAGGQLMANIRRYPSAAAAMAALGAGEVSAVMAPRPQLEAAATEGIRVHEPPLAGLAKAKWTVGVAVHFAYRPLAYAVGDALREAVEDGRIAAIFAAHGLTWTAPAR